MGDVRCNERLGGAARAAGRPFPGFERPRHDTKQRVRCDAWYADPMNQLRITGRKLGTKVTRFEAKLTVRCCEFRMLLLSDDESGIEGVAASNRFGEHGPKVRTDRGDRIGCMPETMELRMVAIAPRASLENPLREKGLPPKRHKSLSIKVPWVKSPKPHGGPSGNRAASWLTRLTASSNGV